MPDLPSSLALTSIEDGSDIVASDHRNNYAAIQTAVNALKTALAGGTTGQVVTATSSSAVDYEYPPGHEFAHVEATATVNITATTEATANSVVSAGAITFDGSTIVMVEFFSPAVQKGTTWIRFALYDGSSSIGVLTPQLTAGGGTVGSVVTLKRRLTPTSASHTYSVRAWVDAGTGEVFGAAGGSGTFVPAYIRITKVS